MSTLNASIPVTDCCRHCHYYSPEGRRGGHCQQLGATVKGEWKACPIMIPAFAKTWEGVATVSPIGCQVSVAPPRKLVLPERVWVKSA